MIGHAGARELVVLGLAFVFSGPVDQVNDLVDAMIGHRSQKLAVLVVEEFGRQLFDDVRQRAANRLDLLELRQICKILGVPLVDFVRQFEALLQ